MEKTLLHYEFRSLLGTGGMGEVHRAWDSRLKREVAIKLLPEEFAKDASRVARFQREAELLALLNHPHIAAIYDVAQSGTSPFIVMELVEGNTLAERVRQGPMRLEEALKVASQIAEALEAAHEKGVIHRDLKPANIKITPEGRVKVLDFGLAKVMTEDSPSGDAPTRMSIPTQAGAIVGTPAYMSPEQARGEASGRGADIWAFGAILYELLAGVAAFGMGTTAETLSKVLSSSPDPARLPPDTPANVRRLIRRCLDKHPRRRFQHIGDVRLEIEEALTPEAALAEPNSLRDTSRPRWLFRIAGLIGIAGAAGLAGWYVAPRSPSPVSAGIIRLSIPNIPNWTAAPFGVRHLAISPDGSRIAYQSGNRLWLRRLDETAATSVSVNTTGSDPFFSPDGQWVGFFGVLGLVKVNVRDGSTVTIVPSSERPAGGTWSADGTIAYATTEGLFQISENGGQPRLLAKADPQRKERLLAWPHFLPDGRSLLYTVVPAESMEGSQIAVIDVSTLQSAPVLKGGSAGWYVPTGHLVYAVGTDLKAIAFDPVSRRIRGDPIPIPDVRCATTLDNGAADFAISPSGTLVFTAPVAERQHTFWWVDRLGKEEALGLNPGRHGYPRVSPDGTRVAMDTYTRANRDIWVWDLKRSSLTQVSDGPAEDMMALWSRNGDRVFFASNRTGTFDVYSQAADGAGGAKVEFAGPGFQTPLSLTPDGKQLVVYEEFRVLKSLDLSQPGSLRPLLSTEYNTTQAEVSPDGNWIAYSSNESGNQYEVFLRPFPNVGGRREKVSIDGGAQPLWGPTGSGELYYRNLEGGVMVVRVTLSPELSIGKAAKLFDWKQPVTSGAASYSISPVDGRFLMTKTAPAPTTFDISVVMNWSEEFKKRVQP